MGLLTTGNRYCTKTMRAGFSGQLMITDTAAAAGGAFAGSTYAGDRGVGLNTDPALTHVFADLSAATAATVNALREAFAFQKILEGDMRGGTRYAESLNSVGVWMLAIIAYSVRNILAEVLSAWIFRRFPKLRPPTQHHPKEINPPMESEGRQR